MIGINLNILIKLYVVLMWGLATLAIRSWCIDKFKDTTGQAPQSKKGSSSGDQIYECSCVWFI